MNLEIFKKDEFEIRVELLNNEPYFMLADVCKCLQIINPSRVAADMLKKDGLRTTEVIDSLNRKQQATFINEANLYKLIFQSRKEEAIKFQDWVTEEVLPSIRKHGAYLTDTKIEEILTNPDTIIKLATDLKAEREKRKTLEIEAKENQPYISFAKAVEASATSALIGDFVKTICDNSVKVGRTRLFNWLRENKYLMKNIKTGDNIPYQKWIDKGYFEVVPKIIVTTSKTIERFTTYITAKGQVALSAKICEVFQTS